MAACPFTFTATDGTGKAITADTTITVGPAVLGCAAVSKSLADIVAVPAAYTASVLYRLGDPLAAGAGVDSTPNGRALSVNIQHPAKWRCKRVWQQLARQPDGRYRALALRNRGHHQGRWRRDRTLTGFQMVGLCPPPYRAGRRLMSCATAACDWHARVCGNARQWPV